VGKLIPFNAKSRSHIHSALTQSASPLMTPSSLADGASALLFLSKSSLTAVVSVVTGSLLCEAMSKLPEKVAL